MITCRYCQVFVDVPESLCKRQRVNDRLYIEKFCREISKTVTSETGSCGNTGFTPTHYFYCDENDQRLRLEICLARQRKLKDECDGCSQGENVKWVAQLAGIIEKPKLVKRGEQAEEPPTVNKIIKRGEVVNKPIKKIIVRDKP